MPEENSTRLIIGSKQVKRFLKNEKPLEKVVIARDANNKDDLDFIVEQCRLQNIPVAYYDSMKELGQICKIDVNAAVVALTI